MLRISKNKFIYFFMVTDMIMNRKIMFFYILAILSLVIMCMLSRCCNIGMNDETYSVLKVILSFSKEQMKQNGIVLGMATNGIGTYWTYLVMSVTLSMPVALYVFHELKSKSYLNVMIRKGKYRYIYSRLLNAMTGALFVVLAAMLIYSVILLICFPMEADNIIVPSGDVYTLGKFISDMMLQIGYFILYGIMLALIGTLFVYIYLDLLFDMSLVFMFAYFSANLFLQDNYIFPAAFIVICTVMYGIIWRIRSAAL